jgi:hypothetical protein
MKKFFLKLEEIWVAAAFAEEGVYETERLSTQRPIIRDSAYRQIAS